jgi:outer membrane protein
MCRRISVLIMGLFFLTASCITVAQTAELPVVRIGIVRDGPWERHPGAVNVFKKEISSMAEGQFDIRFTDGLGLDGDWTAEGIRRSLERSLSDPKIDMIITLGQVASDMACKLKTIPKPIIAPLIMDAKIQGLPMQDGTSGVRNLNYIDRIKSVGQDIQSLGNIVKIQHLAILADGYLLRSLPELGRGIKKFASDDIVNINLIQVETTAKETLANLHPDTDAVLVGPLLRMTPDEFKLLVDGLSNRRLASFSYWGREEVALGILATMTPGATMNHLARSVAVNAFEIMAGENAGNLKIAFSMDRQLTINMETARTIGVYPSLSTLTEADLLNEESRDTEQLLTIEDAVQLALKANMDLAVADRIVAAGAESVLQSRSDLLPQLDIDTTASLIDDDRAEAGGGSAPERTWTGSLTANQLIYSDKVWSKYTTEKHFQDSRVLQREALRLDIIQSAATSYINVLRAKAIERIQKENLKLTRANLQRARVRLTVGAAGPDEVYRWESQIANSRRSVLVAESATLNAMYALNQILHQPLRNSFSVTDVTDTKLFFNGQDWQFGDLVDNTRNIDVLKAFLVEEGVDLSPELQQLKSQIAAQERILSSARREFWLPTVSAQGSVSELFSESGEGQRDDSLVDFDETDWRVGIQATFPLFSGGNKSASFRQSKEELAQVLAQYDATQERIEQRILIAVNRSRASSPGVQLSLDAADTAQKNLKLVTDSYTRGIKSIIDLLDAQNLVLVANQEAANANYDFFNDVIGIQRAVGTFVMLKNPDDRKSWIQKLETFFKEAGIEPGNR